MRIKYPDAWPQADRDALDAMFEQARAEGQWFFTNSLATGPLWFSPEELQAAQENGRFVWGAVNWQLRDRSEMIEQAKRRRDEAQAEVDRTIDRAMGRAVST